MLGILHPLVYNAYLGQPMPAVFTCELQDADITRWIVDGVASNGDALTRRGIVVHPDIEMPPYKISRISIPATEIRVNRIKCAGYEAPPSTLSMRSFETANFYVQGSKPEYNTKRSIRPIKLIYTMHAWKHVVHTYTHYCIGLLEMPQNVSTPTLNSTHNLVSWIEPSTLNITDIEPDIFNYTVCTNATVLKWQCANVSLPEIIIPRYYFEVTIVITAWNIVGESRNSASGVIDACEDINTGMFCASMHVDSCLTCSYV